MTDTVEDSLTVDQAAAQTGVSKAAIRRAIADGEVDTVYAGRSRRITPAALAAYTGGLRAKCGLAERDSNDDAGRLADALAAWATACHFESPDSAAQGFAGRMLDEALAAMPPSGPDDTDLAAELRQRNLGPGMAVNMLARHTGRFVARYDNPEWTPEKAQRARVNHLERIARGDGSHRWW